MGFGVAGGFRVWRPGGVGGLGFRGLWFSAGFRSWGWDSGCTRLRVEDLGFQAWGLGFRVYKLGFQASGLGVRVFLFGIVKPRSSY